MRLVLFATLLMVACGDRALSSDSDGATAPGDLRDAAVAHDLADPKAPKNHRPDDAQCATAPPAGNCFESNNMCTDASCTMGTNGRCVQSQGGALFCFCSYDTCAHDSDCKSGQLCACHGSAFLNGGNTCLDGNCRVDADCGAKGYCSPSHGTSGCGGLSGYYCHTKSDQCVDDEDCASQSGFSVCGYSTKTQRWECVQPLLCP